MKKSLIALALVAGCGASDRESGNASAPAVNAAAPVVGKQGGGAPEPAADSAALTGLYEGPAAQQRNQLCMIERAGKAQFGLIVWGANMHSCSGVGTAARSGDRLTLTMGGDSSCVIDARIEGGTVTLPATLPAGCSYYCGARAQMTGVAFERTGTTAADAVRAKDLAGDSLCETSAG